MTDSDLPEASPSATSSRVATAELAALAEAAVDLAWLAGRRTLADFQAGVAVDRKDDGTPVTRADRGAERLIREGLAARFPDDAIVGEEEDERVGRSGRTWVVDPIDGTKAFIHGVPLYSVLLALTLEDRRPALGVVHLPALGETVVAWRGGGCWWNGRRARVSSTRRLADALVLSSDFPGESPPEPIAGSATLPDVDALYRAARLRRTWGDAYGYTLVATGRADLMIDPVVAPWDIAAVQPILEEAGGRFTDLAGQPTPWAGSGLGTNGLLHDEALAVLHGRSIASSDGVD